MQEQHVGELSVKSIPQVPLAIMVLLSPDLQRDRLYSKSPLSWRLVTTTAGYFVYDLYVHTMRYEFLPSLVHAGAALVVFLSGIYCGILHYYGELSAASLQTPWSHCCTCIHYASKHSW